MLKRICSVLMVCAAPAMADGDALVIANGAYDAQGAVPAARDIATVAETLSKNGYQLVSLSDVSAGRMRAGLEQLLDGIDDATDRLTVVLAGNFAHTDSDTYLLPVNAPPVIDDVTVLNNALPLSTLWPLLAAYPGDAVLILAEGAAPEIAARFASAGLGALNVPQGVTVLRGGAEDVHGFLRRAVARPGLRAVRLAERYGLDVAGFSGADVVLLPEGDIAADTGAADADEALWQRVQERDDAQAYRDYLAAFPAGSHAADARQRIAAIQDEPGRKDRLAEEALALGRDARREIQRDLSLLGYNTRGIDGIFGQGTRAAITAWQADNGLAETTYLTRAQIDRLAAQAQTRAAELEAEAKARQAELERQDTAYWRDTGLSGAEEDLRAYLERFPDGLYAEEAQAQLARIEDARRDRAAEQDRDAWDEARNQGTAGAFRAYLERFPQGAFVAEAQARIAQLEDNRADRDVAERAARQEEALNLNGTARRLVEVRLAQLGLEPGNVDGTFDKRTRRALRRYQEARGLSVTGYLDQGTVVRLLADSL